jgi:DUF1680 family protein
MGDSIYINLYMSNLSTVPFKPAPVIIRQETNYPLDGSIKITINPERSSSFALKLRIPYWIRNQAVPGNLYSYLENKPGDFQLMVNGKNEVPVIENGYIILLRYWSEGDAVELNFPMTVRQIIANDQVVDDRNKVSFEYGPFVYCAEEIDNGKQVDEFLSDENSKMSLEYRKDFLGGINLMHAESEQDKCNLVLIPYYLWSNRGAGKMKVWFPRK